MPSVINNSIRKSVKVIARIKRTFEDLEKAFVKSAGSALSKSNDEFLKRARQIVEKGDLNQVSSLTLDLKEYQTILFSLMVEARRAGRVTGITEGLELKQFYERKKLERKFLNQGLTQSIVNDLADQVTHALNPQNKQIATSFSVVPYDALKFYGDYSLYLKGITEQELLNKAKQKIYSGIQNGLSVQNIMGSLESVFPSFHVGRLQNIARTEISKAMNQGRLESFESPALKGFITAVEFSAILDSRTSDICEDRDGLILAIDDPRLKMNTPPLHYQCRSILVPVDKYSMVEEGLDGKVGKGWDGVREPMEGFGGVRIKNIPSLIPKWRDFDDSTVREEKGVEVYKDIIAVGEEVKKVVEEEMGVTITDKYVYPTPEEWKKLRLKYNVKEDAGGFYHEDEGIVISPEFVHIATGNSFLDKGMGIQAIVHETFHVFSKPGKQTWPIRKTKKGIIKYYKQSGNKYIFFEESITEILSRKLCVDKIKNTTPESFINGSYQKYGSLMLLMLIKKHRGDKEAILSELKHIRLTKNIEEKINFINSLDFITKKTEEEKFQNFMTTIREYGIIQREVNYNDENFHEEVWLWFLKKSKKKLEY